MELDDASIMAILIPDPLSPGSRARSSVRPMVSFSDALVKHVAMRYRMVMGVLK